MDLTRVPDHPQPPIRKLKADENDIFNGSLTSLPPSAVIFMYHYIKTETGNQPGAQEVRNERALSVYSRVQNKLTGEFSYTLSARISLMTR